MFLGCLRDMVYGGFASFDRVDLLGCRVGVGLI